MTPLLSPPEPPRWLEVGSGLVVAALVFSFLLLAFWVASAGAGELRSWHSPGSSRTEVTLPSGERVDGYRARGSRRSDWTDERGKTIDCWYSSTGRTFCQ